jgi:hypothetical protein
MGRRRRVRSTYCYCMQLQALPTHGHGAWPYAKERWGAAPRSGRMGVGTWDLGVVPQVEGRRRRRRRRAGVRLRTAARHVREQHRLLYLAFRRWGQAGREERGREQRRRPRAIAAPKAGGADCPAGPGPRGLLSPAVSIALSADDQSTTTTVRPPGPASWGSASPACRAVTRCTARLRRRLRERDLCSGWPRPVPPARPLAVPSRPLQARKDGRMAPRRGCRARARARVICSRHRTVLGPVVACRRDGTVPAGVDAGGWTAPYRRLPARDRTAGCG